MRLLIATMEIEKARNLRALLYAYEESWEIAIVEDGRQALCALTGEHWDILLLHACLPGLCGADVLHALYAREMICPPRVLFLCERDMLPPTLKPDCVAPLLADESKLCRLISILAEKPLPSLAAVQLSRVEGAVDRLLELLSMNRELKGRAYSRWLLCRYVPAPGLERLSMNTMYTACAKAFSTTSSAVERCLRVAVEGVFTQGSIAGIERCFGATVDPEKGKPTNRAFLFQAAQQIRLFLGGGALCEQERDAP